MTYISGDNKKFRATFATHHDGKEAIPLPTGPFPDESELNFEGVLETLCRVLNSMLYLSNYNASFFTPKN